MENMTIKSILTAIMLGCFIPVQAMGIMEGVWGALCLTPAAIGSYGTYKTLTEPSYGQFDQNGRGFVRAMDQANPQSASTALRESAINFDKHFQSHEKMAMIGSTGALLVGAILIPTGIIGSLIAYYKYFRAEDKEDKDKYWKSLTTRLKLSGIGMISLLAGAVSTGLLADYARSANVR